MRKPMFAFLSLVTVVAGCSRSPVNGGGGAGGSPTPVTPCNQLGPVGEWQEITPPQFLKIPGASWDGGTNDTPLANAIGVNPKDQSVFVSGFTWHGRSTGMLKSLDCGATWTKVSTGRNSAALDSGAQWALQIDPVDPQTMYIANGYGGPPSLFKTENGGVDWDDLFPMGSEVYQTLELPSFTQAIGMDPTDSHHLVVTFHANCKGAYAPMCMAETKDAGATWHLFKGPPQAKGWSEASSVTVLGANRWILTSPDAYGAFYTSDSGQTWTELIHGPVVSSYTGNGYFAPDGALYLGVASTGIFVSRADAAHPLGSSFTLIPSSPQASTFVSDGVTLFASYGPDTSGQPMYSAPLNDTSNWTHLKTSGIGRGSGNFVYDNAHHVVYSPDDAYGVWRVVTR
jgi:photosystem II stability/assembly factor-like uncharacterized protein